MTAWPSEREAIENMIQHYGTGLFSVVMDSYDYAAVRLRRIAQQSNQSLATAMACICLAYREMVASDFKHRVHYCALQALDEVLPSIASKKVCLLLVHVLTP